jgi:hypothetical protein
LLGTLPVFVPSCSTCCSARLERSVDECRSADFQPKRQGFDGPCEELSAGLDEVLSAAAKGEKKLAGADISIVPNFV